MHNTGMLFTGLVSFLVFLSALNVGWRIYLKRKELDGPMTAYAIFLLITAALWFFVALRFFFAWKNQIAINKNLFFVDQVFVFLSGIPLAYYLSFQIFKKKKVAKIITCFLGIIFLTAIIFLFIEGVEQVGEPSYFAIKYQTGVITFGLFAATVIPLILGAFFLAIKKLSSWLKEKKDEQQIQDFSYSLVILIYLVLGIIDEKGIVANWGLVFSRLLFTAIFLLAYVVFQSRYKQKDEAVYTISEKTFSEKNDGAEDTSQKNTIFKKILTILILLSLVPVIFSSFLTITSYNNAFSVLEKCSTVNTSECDMEPGTQISQLQKNILIQISLILFLLVILVLFTGILIARSITRPISILAQGAHEIGGGNLEVQFKIKSKNEFGELAHAFNEMTIKLKEQRERERLVAKLKTEFISIAAHQLRTPLSSVKWILKMLIDGDFDPLTDKQKEFAGKGYEANDRMINLVNDLLDASRIEEGRFGFEFKPDNLNTLLKDAAQALEEQATKNNIKLKVGLPSKPFILVFDAQRLKMAVNNLIDNAIRYTKPGGEVTVSAEKNGDFVKISVEDSGIGIPADQKDRVFTKFFRADNVIRMQVEGTGLGLYLTKNIIEKHGGRIWFETGKNRRGTVFNFTIPAN